VEAFLKHWEDRQEGIDMRLLPTPTILEPHDISPDSKRPVKEGLYSSVLDTDEKTDQDLKKREKSLNES